MPPFVCFTFKYLRENSSMRHGFKRFGAIGEAAVTDGVPAAAILTPLNDCAIALSLSLPAYTVIAGAPVALIPGSAAVAVVPQRMREYTALNPVLYSVVPQVVFSRVGSQNSRKFGVGV